MEKKRLLLKDFFYLNEGIEEEMHVFSNMSHN